MYAPKPWIRRRVDYTAGVVHVVVIFARLRERLATNSTRMNAYFQWLVDRGVVAEYRREKYTVHLTIRLPSDNGT
jgi:hypothetical protein